jgi:hypothetical protein
MLLKKKNPLQRRK